MGTSRSGLLWLLAAGIALAAIARANPMPESAVYVHVQPVRPDFCSANPITECSQIAQYTFDTGELEFDIFLWAPDPRPLYACDLVLSWPSSWQYRGMEVCHDGWGWIDAGSTGGTLHLEWWWGPTMENDVFLAARVSLGVDGYGTFATENGPGTITWGETPETVPIDWRLSATAGVTCAYCYHSCPNGGICAPTLSPAELIFEVPTGGIDQQKLEGGVYPPYGGYTIDIQDTESWISLSVVHGPWPDYWEIKVFVDATGLEPGDYQGWVTATCGCRDCTRVTLHVLPSQSVPEEPDESPPEASPTWGVIKALYR